jgi:hypothetical protein
VAASVELLSHRRREDCIAPGPRVLDWLPLRAHGAAPALPTTTARSRLSNSPVWLDARSIARSRATAPRGASRSRAYGQGPYGQSIAHKVIPIFLPCRHESRRAYSSAARAIAIASGAPAPESRTHAAHSATAPAQLQREDRATHDEERAAHDEERATHDEERATHDGRYPRVPHPYAVHRDNSR